jgi:hypothetical protein
LAGATSDQTAMRALIVSLIVLAAVLAAAHVFAYSALAI